MSRPYKTASFFQSFGCAIRGLIVIFQRDRNFKLQCSIALGVILISIFSKLSMQEWLWIVLAIGLVLISELINSVFELTLDRISTESDVQIKVAKDVSAGFVLLSSFLAIVIGGFVFYNKFKHGVGNH